MSQRNSHGVRYGKTNNNSSFDPSTGNFVVSLLARAALLQEKPPQGSTLSTAASSASDSGITAAGVSQKRPSSNIASGVRFLSSAAAVVQATSAFSTETETSFTNKYRATPADFQMPSNLTQPTAKRPRLSISAAAAAAAASIDQQGKVPSNNPYRLSQFQDQIAMSHEQFQMNANMQYRNSAMTALPHCWQLPPSQLSYDPPAPSRRPAQILPMSVFARVAAAKLPSSTTLTGQDLRSRNIFMALERHQQKHSFQNLQQEKEQQKKTAAAPASQNSDDRVWNAMFQTLQAFYEAHGHCCVTPDIAHGNQQFNAWLIDQRTLYKKCLLADERQAKLDEIGFDWDGEEKKKKTVAESSVGRKEKSSVSLVGTKMVDAKETPRRKRMRSFEENFQALVEYKNEFGHCDVPQKNGKLGIWVKNVRQNPNRFTDDQRERLDSIGFKWRKLQLDEQWNDTFRQLVQYRDTYGDCNVPSRWKKSPALARWVHTQRTMYRNDRLLEGRKEKLENAGFVWDCNAMREDEAFHENYEKLVEYKCIQGHCNVPSKYRRDRSLGRWAAKMRELHACQELDADRLKALNDIGFVWNVSPSPMEDDDSDSDNDSNDEAGFGTSARASLGQT